MLLTKSFIKSVRNVTSAMLILCGVNFCIWGFTVLEAIPIQLSTTLFGIVTAIQLSIMLVFGLYIIPYVRKLLEND